MMPGRSTARAPRPCPAFPLRVVDVPRAPGETLLKACAALGISLSRGKRLPPHRAIPCSSLRGLLAHLPHARITLLTGPSGSGKSTLLHALAHELRASGQRCIRVPRDPPASPAPIIDLLAGPLASRLDSLARAGLAEATLIARPPSSLSDGQRARFLLARSMHRAIRCRASWLLADEFASTLDRVTARALSWTIARWARRSGCAPSLILASAHEDILRFVRPDLVIACSLDGAWNFVHKSASVLRSCISPGGKVNDLAFVHPDPSSRPSRHAHPDKTAPAIPAHRARRGR